MFINCYYKCFNNLFIQYLLLFNTLALHPEVFIIGKKLKKTVQRPYKKMMKKRKGYIKKRKGKKIFHHTP